MRVTYDAPLVAVLLLNLSCGQNGAINAVAAFAPSGIMTTRQLSLLSKNCYSENIPSERRIRSPFLHFRVDTITSLHSTSQEGESDASSYSDQKLMEEKEKQVTPDLLKPFPEAADPMYAVRGPVGEGDFVLSRVGGPTKEELSNENLLKILMIQCSDLEVNTLVWKCLGYRFDAETETWRSDECFPKWKEKYPNPPDLIGMQRIYSKEIDQPSLKANQALVRSVPVDNKQSLKTHLKPLGFRGYQYAELTPNKTRRAQCANWLLYFREELFGYTVEELKERRRLKQEAEEAERRRREEEEENRKSDDDWKPPVKEVF